jgi:hypothetical protein
VNHFAIHVHAELKWRMIVPDAVTTGGANDTEEHRWT